jgi:hypothetical protein
MNTQVTYLDCPFTREDFMLDARESLPERFLADVYAEVRGDWVLIKSITLASSRELIESLTRDAEKHLEVRVLSYALSESLEGKEGHAHDEGA